MRCQGEVDEPIFYFSRPSRTPPASRSASTRADPRAGSRHPASRFSSTPWGARPNESKRPWGSFLLLGPTGVGKTELSISFTRYLLGDEKLFRFDMSEYQTQDSLGILLGARIGEVGLLGMARQKSATGTLLFDEIEKAHPRVLDLLPANSRCRARDDGKWRDPRSQWFLCRLHVEHRRRRNPEPSTFLLHHNGAPRPGKAQQTLRPELYARITEKLVFNRLSYDVQMEISRLHIARELAFLRDKGFEFTLGHSVVSFLMQRGFHPRLGARPLRDTIERHLRGAAADATLAQIAASFDGVRRFRENHLLLRACSLAK